MDSTNRNTALASAMVEELARCGVRRAAVSPGSRSTPLAIALWRHPAIDVTVLLDERSAGFWALGASLGGGAPAAVLCTSGTAAANLHPAVCEADEASVPLIVLTADRPPELRGTGSGQTVDQIKLYGDAPRWFCEVGTHEADDAGLLHFRAVACRAFAAAAGDARPGPVHLNVAWRDPLHPVPVEGDVSATDPLALEGRGERPLVAVSPRAAELDGSLLDELAERIAASPRGLIVAGRMADAAHAEAVTELAGAAGYPILAEPLSQLRRGRHDRSAVISHYDLVVRSGAEGLRPDFIVRFGDLPTSRPLRDLLGSPGAPEQLVVDPGATWKEPTRRASLVARAPEGPTARALADRLKAAAADPGRAERGWSDLWRRADDAVAQVLEAELDAGGEGETALTEPGAIRALGRRLADGEIVLTASSMPVRDAEAFLPGGPEAVRFIANRGANGIDGLISTASGAVASAGDRGWAVLGDLAVAHDLNGLAVLRGTPGLRLLVLDNSGGGIFHFLPQAQAMAEEEFEALLGTPSRLDLARAAEVFGVASAVAESPEELEGALDGEARVVVARTQRQANVEVHGRLAELSAAAVAGVTASAG